jgi:hypothetical protein
MEADENIMLLAYIEMLFFIVSFDKKPTLYVSKSMYDYILNLPINKNITQLNIIKHVKEIILDENRNEFDYGTEPKECIIDDTNKFFEYDK